MQKQIYQHLAAAGSGYWWNQGRQYLVHGLLRQYNPRPLPDPDFKILDIGCAAGGTLFTLAKLGEAWGLDISAEAIALCRSWGIPDQHLVLGDAERMTGFSDASFDLVTAVEIIEHLENPEAALAEIKRILRPGGLLILTVPADMRLWSERDIRLEHRQRYTLPLIAAYLEKTGFAVVKSSYANAFYYWPLRFWLAFRRGILREPVPRVRTDTLTLAPWLSAILTWFLKVEARIILRHRLPWGVSAVCVARKQPGATNDK